MKITNKTSFPLTAVGWHIFTENRGKAISIPSGKTGDVSGPLLGKMGGGICSIVIWGEITCHEEPDNEVGFQVIEETPLTLGGDGHDRGVIVMHRNDHPIK